MPHHRVIEQLERGFHTPDELVGCGGDELVPIRDHPDFAAYFIDGDSRSQQLKRTVTQRRRRQGKRQRRLLVSKSVKGLLSISLLGATVWFLPDAVTLGKSFFLQATSTEATSADEEVSAETEEALSRIEILISTLEEELVLGQADQAFQNNGPVTVESEYERAWSLLLSGQSNLESTAVEIMERVLVETGGESWALSTLIFAKCALIGDDVDRLAEVQGLISILSELTAASDVADLDTEALRWETEMAYAALARHGGVWHEAAVHSENCLALRPTEAGCAWIGAEAWNERGEFGRADEALAPLLERWPESTELQLVRVGGLVGRGDYLEAKDTLESLYEAYTESEEGHMGVVSAYADFQMSTGDFHGAANSYEELLAIEGGTIEGRFNLGRLRLQLLQDYSGAYELLGPLAQVGGSGNIDRLLLASHSARMMGEHEVALDYATTVAEARREWGPGVLAQAMAYDAMGRTEEAAAVLQQVRTGSLSGRDAARFYLWEANFHNRQEFGRLSTIAHAEVERHNEDLAGLLVSKIQLALLIGGKGSIVDLLSQAHLLDLEAEEMASPLIDTWYPDEDWSSLAVEVGELFSQDPTMTQVFDRTVGLAGIFDCLRGSNCSRVIHHLDLALDRDGTDVAALAGLGRVYYSQARYPEAVRYLQRALGEAGDSPVLQAMYGDSLWRVGRQPEAEVAFQQALHTAGTSSVAARRYAVALAEWGRFDEAAEIGARALLLDENDTETLRLLVATGVAVE